jgi:hypothetical protein
MTKGTFAMPQGNWKSLTLLGSVTVLAAVLLVDALLSLSGLPLLSWTGLAPLAVLFLLTIASGRFTVSVTNADGFTQSQKSVADAFVFLAVMMYAPQPANTVAPAIVLALLVGFISSRRSTDRRIIIFALGAAVISTYVAASLYGLIVRLLAGGGADAAEHSLPLGTLLFPLCVLALVQYFTSLLATAAFVVFDSGKMRLTLSRESLVWTSITQIAAASSAALFYSALHDGGIPFVFVGLLIIALVHLLYRFDEQRFDEIRRSEEAKRLHVVEMAEMHMNTIESLAIAIDAKDQTTHGHVRRTQIYAVEMGKLLGVSEPETQALVAGALLHDIGKLAVPEYILNKPGKLT